MKKLPFTGELNRLTSSYYLAGQTKGFTLVCEDFEKIEKHYHNFAPMVRTKVLPIIELGKVLRGNTNLLQKLHFSFFLETTQMLYLFFF